jgi:glucans biosynthesis protein C
MPANRSFVAKNQDSDRSMDERRYIGLDALRGFMMLLGIVVHSAMLYLASPPVALPLPTDKNNSEVFDVLVDFIHSFRMPLFFLVAGFFAALMFERRGMKATLRNRVRRIFLPWLASLVVILPLLAWLSANFWLAARYGTHSLIPDWAKLVAFGEEMKQKIGPRAEEPMMGHLWFLYYLCMFYLLVPLIEWGMQKTALLQAGIRRAVVSPWAALGFGLWTALTLWPYQGAQVFEGFVYFLPHPPSLLYYGTFFVLGYVFHTHQDFFQTAQRCVLWAWIGAAVCFPLSIMATAADTNAGGKNLELHLVAMLFHGLCTWALIYGFIGAALRFFDRPSRTVEYIAQSAYWVYLVHSPLVMLAGWCLIPFDLPAMLKFVLVCLGVALVAFAAFHYAVQNTWMGVFLNGRRVRLDWPWRRMSQANRQTSA